MGQIAVLDQNMINMIAAGEVIERPASIVKELVENSIDAGATKITVSIEDGGRKSVSVTDNGSGMDCEDLAYAYEPHATSKIKSKSDLHKIATLGFRGEALASISSIAQVKTVSRTKGSDQANCLEIDCGKKTDIAPCSGDYGTTIQVRDLFYKLPARYKFLKTANTEMSHITECFTRIALAHRNLDMTLIHNGREMYQLSGKESAGQRIAKLFSSEISENLIETESNEKNLHIFALLGRPTISRTNSKFQYVFLNGRFIRDKFISHAIKEAYRGSLEPGRFAVVFLFIKMPYDDYDVNVHPTKVEVRFYNANLVHSQVLGHLREKLLGTNLDTQAGWPTKSPRSQQVSEAMTEFFKKHKPIQTQQQISFGARGINTNSSADFKKNILTSTSYTPLLNAIQIHDSFIITQTDDGFIIIDQHALHERIIYEKLHKRIGKGNLESQKLLIPESFELTDFQADAVKTNSKLIEKLGIELVPFGPGTMAIQAFPSLLAKTSPLDFVSDLIDLISSKTSAINADELLDKVLNMAACKAAIKAGQKLSDSEIEQLLADRENTDRPSLCPHGRPTTITFSLNQLEKQFKRT